MEFVSSVIDLAFKCQFVLKIYSKYFSIYQIVKWHAERLNGFKWWLLASVCLFLWMESFNLWYTLRSDNRLFRIQFLFYEPILCICKSISGSVVPFIEIRWGLFAVRRQINSFLLRPIPSLRRCDQKAIPRKPTFLRNIFFDFSSFRRPQTLICITREELLHLPGAQQCKQTPSNRVPSLSQD